MSKTSPTIAKSSARACPRSGNENLGTTMAVGETQGGEECLKPSPEAIRSAIRYILDRLDMELRRNGICIHQLPDEVVWVLYCRFLGDRREVDELMAEYRERTTR